MKGGTPWFDKAMQITQNSQNQNYMGWSQLESPRNRERSLLRFCLNKILRLEISTIIITEWA